MMALEKLAFVELACSIKRPEEPESNHPVLFDLTSYSGRCCEIIALNTTHFCFLLKAEESYRLLISFLL
jgi:hypothetical protein